MVLISGSGSGIQCIQDVFTFNTIFIKGEFKTGHHVLFLFVSDLEKVVNRPQAENSEFYNVLKIA